jgi:hypothetical protein
MMEWIIEAFKNAFSPQSIVQDRFLCGFWILVGYGVKKLRDKLTNPRQKQIATIALVLLSIFLVASVITGFGASQNRPNIHGEIGRVFVSPNEQTRDYHATFAITLVNSGAPSVLWNWRATVTLPSGLTYQAVASDVPAQGQLLSSSKTPSVTLPASEHLSSVLLTRPLSTGEGTRGWVDFSFQGLQQEFPVGSKFEVRCTDSTGKTVVLRKLFGPDVTDLRSR